MKAGMEMERTGGIPRIVICLCQFEGMLYRVPRITYLFTLPMTSAAPQWLRQTYFDNLVARPQSALMHIFGICPLFTNRSKSSKCHNAVKMCNFVESGI